MHPESTIVLLFAAAALVALVTRRLRIPYTVALVLAGLALVAAHLAYGIHLTKELVYSVFLPGLLFEARGTRLSKAAQIRTSHAGSGHRVFAHLREFLHLAKVDVEGSNAEPPAGADRAHFAARDGLTRVSRASCMTVGVWGA